MTNREFYTAIVSANVSDEVTAYAENALAKMDAANEKRRNTPSKTALANAPLIDKIKAEVLTAEPKTASDIAAVLEISVQKASALMRQIVAAGDAEAVDVKVPKRGSQKAYKTID